MAKTKHKRCKVCKFRIATEGDTCWVCQKWEPQATCARCGQEMPKECVSSFDGMCQDCQKESYK